ncbi:MAG: pirin family protein [Acetobacteraceae bacterium]|nr:pirin family protein [Acetobacteraceae bacterium]MDW8397221.1 pirin family protein [Acetobacteraceae bacterium]
MIELRPFSSLGGADHGWLKARHHFSFASYHDPRRVHWGALRVWNDDEIAPGAGFDPHPHRDMEIITYVREGAITHRDSMGNEGRTEAGDVQIMSAGTGVIHSEYNLETVPTRIFQIWIIPDLRGARPNWGTKRFPKENRDGAFEVLASGRAADAGSGALPINADAAVMAAALKPGQSAALALAPGRVAYLVPARGRITVNGIAAGARDGVAVRDEERLTVTATEDAEVVLVEAAA